MAFSIPLSQLFPGEFVLVRSRVQDYVHQIHGGHPVKPVKLIRVDNQWLVRDGNHRCYAAKWLNAKTVEAVEDDAPVRDYDIKMFREWIEDAVDSGTVGFENMRMAETESEREELIRRHEQDRRRVLLCRRLKKRLHSSGSSEEASER